MAYNNNGKKKKSGSNGTLTIIRFDGKEYIRKGDKLCPLKGGNGKNNRKKKHHAF